MKKLLIANWKMELNEAETLDLVLNYKKRLKKITQVEIAFAPSCVYLKEVKNLLGRTHLQLAAQNVAAQAKGKYTGEISAAQIKELGCSYVIVGHSERRIKMNETDDMVNRKINQCYHNDLIPILCIGETLEEKNSGRSDSAIVRQLQAAISKVDGLPENELVIAYEPVWAVGTGQFLEAENIFAFHRTIKRTVSSLYSEKFYNDKVRLLYGGSINSIIAKDYWVSEVLDGILVGGASLDIEEMYNVALEGE
ncbi:triose-phosphate isomerase [Candidatus Kuenenbacteria bacterium]|nr:triose-phosphate isomerase [Candidatus Kuenenbacteria bacterium]